MGRILPLIREVSNDAMEFAIKGETSGGRGEGITPDLAKLSDIQYMVRTGWRRGKNGLPEPPMKCWRW